MYQSQRQAKFNRRVNKHLLNSVNNLGGLGEDNRPPIFVLQENKLRELGLLGDKRSYIQQVGKFFGKVWDIVSFQPVDKCKFTPLTVATHSHYWIITKHPGWFSLAGINTLMPTPEEWENWEKAIYGFFSDKEIRLSNEEKVDFAAELLWVGTSKKKADTIVQARILEDGLYEQYKNIYTKSEVKNALFLAFIKTWILCKRIRALTPKGTEWKVKLQPFGYEDPYALYTGGRIGYQQRIKEAMRLAMAHRVIEILFSIGVDWAIMKNIGDKWPELSKQIKAFLAQIPSKENGITPPPPPPETEFPWVLIAGAGALILAVTMT